MNRAETAVILAKIASGDNRRIDPPPTPGQSWHTPILDEWCAWIGDLDARDAAAAVDAHRRESTEYLTAAHIRARVTAIRRARVAAAGGVMALADGLGHLTGKAYTQALSARRDAVASGAPVAEALQITPAAPRAALTAPEGGSHT